MAGTKKTKHWQRVVLDKLKEIKDHPDFDEDWVILYQSKDHTSLLRTNLERFVLKYNASRGTINYLERFIRFNETSVNNIVPPIFIAS